jgi:transcriptional regulator with XRE-family HTH domain
MGDAATPGELREATHIMGEMAASRLHSVIEDRLAEVSDRLSRADIARRLGVSEQQLSRWITHPRNMTVKSAGRLLAALEAQLLFELDRYEDIAKGNAASSFVVSVAEAAGVNANRSLNARGAVTTLAPGPAGSTRNSDAAITLAGWTGADV